MSTAHEFTRAINMLADTFRPYGWTEQSVDGYLIALNDLTVDQVRAAVVVALQTEERMPAPATLRRLALEGIVGEVLGPEEAWAEVERAVAHYGYVATPSWSSPLIADTVAACGGWTRLCQSSDTTGLRIRFTKAYARNAERAERDALLSPGFAALALTVGHVNELGDGSDHA